MSGSEDVARRYGGRRALVVETDPETRRLAQEVLETVGFIVDVVDNGVDAVAAARQNPPALILMDLQLRDVGGLEVLLWLRANPALRRVPVIAISVIQGDLPAVRHARIAVVMRKPLSVPIIARAIETAMDNSG
jgi:two-component system, cell cycle response regulator DivK